MDIFNSLRKRILIAGIITAGACLLMVIFPTTALYSARKGISLWMSNVLPALLPFFICANFLQYTGVISCLKNGVFPFVMSVLSGYPMGAKIIGDLRRSGEISVNEAKRLLSFCSTSGPAFMIGAVGAGMLGSGLAGGVIAAAHYAGALANGALYTKILGRDNSCASHGCEIKCESMQESFTEAILSSFKALAVILAYIVMFTFITDMMHLCGIFSIFENMSLRAVIKGFFEMTVGCGAAAELEGISLEAKCVMCAGIMSWGGLSVMGQTMSMMAGTGVKGNYIFASKATHCLFSSAAALIIGKIML